MKMTRISLCLGVLMAVLCVIPAQAQTFNLNLKTFMTVDKPVQVPGAVLQPNVKYIFRRLAPEAGLNHTIVVQRADDHHVVATFSSISDQHLDAPGRTVFTFYETAAGYAPAIREWTYPDRTTGFQFLYPKHQMTEISAHLINRNEVETQTAQAQPAPETAPAPAVTAEDQSNQSEAREKPSDVTSDNSTTTDQNDQQNANAEPDVQSEQAAAQPTELPKTAGELPLLLLVGLAAIGLRKSIRS